MIFEIQLRHEQRTRRFTIRPASIGWEVCDEEDGRVLRQVRYADWHRVELAWVKIRRAADLRCQQGWLISSRVP